MHDHFSAPLWLCTFSLLLMSLHKISMDLHVFLYFFFFAFHIIVCASGICALSGKPISHNINQVCPLLQLHALTTVGPPAEQMHTAMPQKLHGNCQKNVTKSFKCQRGLEITQIQIWLHIHGMCLKKKGKEKKCRIYEGPIVLETRQSRDLGSTATVLVCTSFVYCGLQCAEPMDHHFSGTFLRCSLRFGEPTGVRVYRSCGGWAWCSCVFCGRWFIQTNHPTDQFYIYNSMNRSTSCIVHLYVKKTGFRSLLWHSLTVGVCLCNTDLGT